MLLKPAAALPRGNDWKYELKFDGFRGLAVKDGENVRLYSRNGRDLSKRFAPIVEGLGKLRFRSGIIDGEIVCLDSQGRPCFEDLQNSKANFKRNLFFYAFDLVALNGASLMDEELEKRKKLLQKVIPETGSVRISDFIDGDPDALVSFARENRLEGIVAKRRGSRYEPGMRSGAWVKFKTYQHAHFLVGGFLPSSEGAEALAVGFFSDGSFKYAARLENYFKGSLRAELWSRLMKLKSGPCPFERVPIKKAGDCWSVGLTAEDAARFTWVIPRIQVVVRFIECTRIGLLRQAGLVGISAEVEVANPLEAQMTST